MTAVPGTSEPESLRIGERVAQAMGAVKGVKSVAQWVGRAQNGADTFGTHYSEFEVEIGTLSGERTGTHPASDPRTLTGIRASSAVAATPASTSRINTFLTERIEETISGFAAPMVVNIYGQPRCARPRCSGSRRRAGNVPGATDVQVQSPPGTPQLNIRLRPERMAQWGLKPLDVLESIRSAYEGVPAAQVYRGQPDHGSAWCWHRASQHRVAQVGSPDAAQPRREARAAGGCGRHQPHRRAATRSSIRGRRIQTVTCNVARRDIEQFAAEVRDADCAGGALRPRQLPAFYRRGRGPGAIAGRPHRAFAAGRRRHFPDALHRLRALAQPAAHLRQPALRADRRRARGAVHRRLDVARLAGRLRHVVRHHPAQLHHAGVALPAPGGSGRACPGDWRPPSAALPSACRRF